MKASGPSRVSKVVHRSVPITSLTSAPTIRDRATRYPNPSTWDRALSPVRSRTPFPADSVYLPKAISPFGVLYSRGEGFMPERVRKGPAFWACGFAPQAV